MHTRMTFLTGRARTWSLALALWMVLPVPGPAATRIKLATLAPKGSSFHQTLLAMGEEWKQAPNGGVSLTIFTDGTMGSEADMVRRMRIGQIQAAMLTAVGLGEIDRSVTALQLMPMMFNSWDEVDYVREKMQGQFEQALLDKGFVVLFWGDAGWVHYFSKEPVLTPDDLRKLKVFVTAGSGEGTDILKEMGYHPVPLETTDILPGLQTGLISAVPTIPVYANAGQFYREAPHMLALKWVPLVGGTVISKRVWDRLAPAAQAALKKSAAEAGRKIRSRSREENDEAVEAMQKRGLQVHPVTPDLRALWQKTADEAYPKIRGQMVPAPIFDEAQALLRQYRAAHPEK